MSNGFFTTAPSTIVNYPLNGQVEFIIPFEFLARKFVVVTLIGATKKVLVMGTDYRFVAVNKIQLAAQPDGSFTNIELRRVTSATDRLVSFVDGSILHANDLNLSHIQTLHVAEEARDAVYVDGIGINYEGHYDARGRKIVNLRPGTSSTDAVTVAQLLSTTSQGTEYANVKYYGAVGDGVADDTAAVQQAIYSGLPVGLFNGTFRVGTLYGLNQVVSHNATLLHYGVGTKLSLDVTGHLDILGETYTAAITSFNTIGDTFVISFDGTVSGEYVLLSGTSNSSVKGLYRVVSIVGSELTIEAGKLFTGIPANLTGTITSFSGNLSTLQCSGRVTCSNLLVNVEGADYGVQAGGSHSSSPVRPLSSIDLDTVGIVGATNVGVLAANGSSIGVRNVGTLECNRGFMSFRSSSLIGVEASARKSTDDAFKCEHGANMYIDGYLVDMVSQQSGLGCRYNGSQEMANGVIGGTKIAGGISQFSGYLSVRDTSIHNGGRYAGYCVDGASLVWNRVASTGSTVNSVRVLRGSSFNSLTALGTGDSTPLFSGSSIIINGVTHAGDVIENTLAAGTINAGSRYGKTISVSGLVIAYKPDVSITALTELPAGVVLDWAVTADKTLRVYLTNTSTVNKTVGDVVVLIHI